MMSNPREDWSEEFPLWCDGGHEISGEILRYFEDIFLMDKAHLTVYLIKFTAMTVSPWIFIAETRRYLEIFIDTSYHEELFVLLRSLWKCIKFPRMETRGDEIVPSTLWRTDSEEGSLHFEKIPTSEPFSRIGIDLSTELDFFSLNITA
jgi:hypothetical protein